MVIMTIWTLLGALLAANLIGTGIERVLAAGPHGRRGWLLIIVGALNLGGCLLHMVFG